MTETLHPKLQPQFDAAGLPARRSTTQSRAADWSVMYGARWLRIDLVPALGLLSGAYVTFEPLPHQSTASWRAWLCVTRSSAFAVATRTAAVGLRRPMRWASMNSESAGSRATICASDSPDFVYCSVFLPPNVKTMSAVHCPRVVASIALPTPVQCPGTRPPMREGAATPVTENNLFA